MELLPIPSPPLKNYNFNSTSKNPQNSRNWTPPVECYLKRKLVPVSNIPWMIVDTYKTLFLFNEPLTWYALPYFRSLSMKSRCRTLASYRTTGVTLFEPIFQRLLINYSLRFHCHILGISKVTNYSVLNHF